MKSGIIYKGQSLLDGKPVVAIATYSDRNTKTGKVLQTYIIRSDISPLDASKTGADFSICGDCKFRGTPTEDPKRKQAIKRDCYVNLGQGPTIVYKAYKRGTYPIAQAYAGDSFTVDQVQDLGRGRIVRLGTYGDPAAIPSSIWDRLISRAESHLAYTHQSGFRPDIAMQSADTKAQAVAFWNNGARTFRVITDIGDVVKGKEILCPASKEAGRRVQCNACKLCGGNSTNSPKSIAIVQH